MTRARTRRSRKHGGARDWAALNRPLPPGGLFRFESEVWLTVALWLSDFAFNPSREADPYNHAGPRPDAAAAVLVEHFGDLDTARRAWASLHQEVKERHTNVGAWMQETSQ